MGAMTSRLILATRNAGKIAELHAILSDAGLPHELVGADAYPQIPDVKETGISFAENALLKAHALAQATGLPAIADDSGLCVDALNGMPGVLSARWAGTAKDDAANNDLLLQQLEDVPDERRGAHFTCAVAFGYPVGAGGISEHVVHGEMRGRVIRELRGDGGFGYDVLFVADDTVAGGDCHTSAELDPDAKDAISHRGKALRAIAPVVADVLTGL